MHRNWRLIPHTADMGVFVRGTTLAEVLAGAAAALTDLMVELESIRPRTAVDVQVEAESADRLLVRWLTELLYLFGTRLFVACEFDIRSAGPTAVQARLVGERFDPERHPFHTEIKAATYHRLRVEQTARGWRAFFIVDL